jgi:ABC-type uncharacterized transport system involved in gliding motility auxiliary subunit
MRQLFEQLYEVRSLDLNSLKEVPKDVDALFVLAPDKKIEEPAQRAIDAFLLTGKSAAFFLDTGRADIRTFNITPVDHGLGPLLSTYGVKVGESLVADVQSAELSLREQRGPFQVAVPVRYPFIPTVLKLEGDSPITRGLTNLNLPFMSSLALEPRQGLTETVLAQSSKRSWLEPKPFNTDPRRDWSQPLPTFGGPYPLLVQVTGNLPSHFGGKTASAPSRVIVAGGSVFAWDPFMGPPNAALLLNVADFLLLDPAMLAMRTRGLTEAPLKRNLSDGVRGAAKYGNAVGVPLLLSAFGLVRWRMRERRRARVSA